MEWQDWKGSRFYLTGMNLLKIWQVSSRFNIFSLVFPFLFYTSGFSEGKRLVCCCIVDNIVPDAGQPTLEVGTCRVWYDHNYLAYTVDNFGGVKGSLYIHIMSEVLTHLLGFLHFFQFYSVSHEAVAFSFSSLSWSTVYSTSSLSAFPPLQPLPWEGYVLSFYSFWIFTLSHLFDVDTLCVLV